MNLYPVTFPSILGDNVYKMHQLYILLFTFIILLILTHYISYFHIPFYVHYISHIQIIVYIFYIPYFHISVNIHFISHFHISFYTHYVPHFHTSYTLHCSLSHLFICITLLTFTYLHIIFLIFTYLQMHHQLHFSYLQTFKFSYKVFATTSISMFKRRFPSVIFLCY